MSSIDLSQLDVFYGELSIAAAHVYARFPRPATGDGLALRGHVRGPRCLYSTTLPLTARLIDLGPGPTLLARALVPDPSYWSPDLPAVYDVTIDLLQHGNVIASERREIGFRPLGARDTSLVSEGKRWVLRGVRESSTHATLPRQWHDAAAAFVTRHSNQEALAEASQFGALTVVEIQSGEANLEARLKQLARGPGVALVALEGGLVGSFDFSNVAPNLLLAQRIHAHDELRMTPWAKAAWIETSDLSFLARAWHTLKVPIIAVRPLDSRQSLELARAECDRLQRELATHGQFAGYVV